MRLRPGVRFQYPAVLSQLTKGSFSGARVSGNSKVPSRDLSTFIIRAEKCLTYHGTYHEG